MYLSLSLSLSNPLVYAAIIVTVEVLLCVLIISLSTSAEWLVRGVSERVSKGSGSSSDDLCNIPEDTLKLFVSRSTTQCWTNEYAIVVVLQCNHTSTTRIIDMSYLDQDTKLLFRKYQQEFLHVCFDTQQAMAVKIYSTEVFDADAASLATVLSRLLHTSVDKDLHKIPMNGSPLRPELLSVFPTLLEFLYNAERCRLQQCSPAMRLLVQSCSEGVREWSGGSEGVGEWSVCGLPCITATRGVSPPDQFDCRDTIFIKCNGYSHDSNSNSNRGSGDTGNNSECENEIVSECASDSDSDEDPTVMQEFIDLEECLYEKKYLYSCHLISTLYGWGMFARKIIPAHTSLITYTGELISNEETEKRQMQYDRQSLNYILTVKEHSRPDEPTTGTCLTTTSETSSRCKRRRDGHGHATESFTLRTNIDATYRGGAARFINHSCEPNLTIEMRRSSGSIIASPVLTTLRVISPGEQLTFDYGDDSEGASTTASALTKEPLQSNVCLEDNITQAATSRNSGASVATGGGNERWKCLCGSRTCRKWLPDASSCK